MASLREYFFKDGANNLTMHETWPVTNNEGVKSGDLTARLHLDFEANAKYISFFFPEMSDVDCPEAIALNEVEKFLEWPETQIGIQAGLGEESNDAGNLVFTGQIYLYSERPVPDNLKARLIAEARGVGHRLTFRSSQYVIDRNKWERPRAFISHDSLDKTIIAGPLAQKLQRFMCPVWYDEFSLRVGDSLRENIERGLKECEKCIIVITPNFIRNDGWSKREFDSIYTRELIEKQNVILPIWDNVSVDEVYKFSPILADRFALQWSQGVEVVAQRLLQVIGV